MQRDSKQICISIHNMHSPLRYSSCKKMRSPFILLVYSEENNSTDLTGAMKLSGPSRHRNVQRDGQMTELPVRAECGWVALS